MIPPVETTSIPDAPADLGDSKRFWPIWWRTAERKKGGALTSAARIKLLTEICRAFDLTQARETLDAERHAAWDQFHSGQHKLGIVEEMTMGRPG